MISCKAKKQVLVNRKAADSSPAAASVNPAVSKISAIKGKQVYFSTFSGKAHTKLNIDGSSNDVTLNIRISRDKKIWVSITAIAGIEVARALITPDSILVINRLQSLYLRKPFSFIYAYTGRQIDYKSLEAVLVGNVIPQLLNDSTRVAPGNGNVLLSGNIRELIYKLTVGPDLKLSQADLSNQSQGQSLLVNNTVFIQEANRVLPSQIDIASTVRAKKVQVSIHYVKVDFDQPLEFPFNIPSRYTEAN